MTWQECKWCGTPHLSRWSWCRDCRLPLYSIIIGLLLTLAVLVAA